MLVVLGRVQLLSSLLQRAVAAVHRPAVERPLLLEALPPRLDVLLAPPARATGGGMVGRSVDRRQGSAHGLGFEARGAASLGGSSRRGTAASARGRCRTGAALAPHRPPSWSAGRRPCTRRRPSLALTFGSALAAERRHAAAQVSRGGERGTRRVRLTKWHRSEGLKPADIEYVTLFAVTELANHGARGQCVRPGGSRRSRSRSQPRSRSAPAQLGGAAGCGSSCGAPAAGEGAQSTPSLRPPPVPARRPGSQTVWLRLASRTRCNRRRTPTPARVRPVPPESHRHTVCTTLRPHHASARRRSHRAG